ncbi:MAG: microcin C ABC transporter permease YejB [Rickettsiales bacterium]|jgi:microcin C transport system permease protein|nr:microcin C ABC transporter permease YejB [Rickettsiales bacterium]
MLRYISKRILLILPTLIGILFINFIIIQFAPGGPVSHVMAQLKYHNSQSTNMLDTTSLDLNSTQLTKDHNYLKDQGLDNEIVLEIKTRFGFDKPPLERFLLMVKNYLSFNFGESFFKGQKVTDLIIERLPISISLGLWSTLLIYIISIPLGIKKAVANGSKFDLYSSLIIFTFYSIPAFLFAIFLIVIFAKGGYVPIFPLSGLISDNFTELSFFGKIKDYIQHLFLPTLALIIGGFASLTMLTKNCFLDELSKQYVLTAKAKGLNQSQILYGHVFRNSMILVISSFPETLIKILFTSSLLIEIIFSLDGLGLLGFESAISRDYPVIFATIYIYSLIGLVFNLISDIIYVAIDPRINFSDIKDGF